MTNRSALIYGGLIIGFLLFAGGGLAARNDPNSATNPYEWRIFAIGVAVLFVSLMARLFTGGSKSVIPSTNSGA